MKQLNAAILSLFWFYGPILSQVVCPDPVTYSPCECTEYTGSNGFVMTTSTLDCSNRNLTDSLLNDVLNIFILNPLISQVNHLILYSNQLTRVPTQIPLMRWLTFVNLSDNKIQSVETASFNFACDKMNLIDLSSNQITSIQSDSFQGSYFNYSKIFLDKNNLIRFERDVFLPVLQQMEPDIDFPYGYTSIGQNPIDCTSDPCHMAWLIRDNPNLMKHVYYANCSNGTRFEDLDPNDYNNCPT